MAEESEDNDGRSSNYSGFYSINEGEQEDDRHTMKRSVAKKSALGSIYGGGGRADSFKTCKDDEELPD